MLSMSKRYYIIFWLIVWFCSVVPVTVVGIGIWRQLARLVELLQRLPPP